MGNRAAIYVHPSAQDQSLAKQTLVLETFCSSHGLEVSETYQDVGKKGATGAKSFPAFKQMIKDAKSKLFDVAVFHSIEALGVAVPQMMKNMDAIHRGGVCLVFIREDIDTSTARGRSMLDMVAILADIDKKQAQDRVRAGLARRKAEGLNVGRPTISKVKEMQIKILREEGIGILKIARKVGCGVSAVQRVVKEMEEFPTALLAPLQTDEHHEGEDERQLDLGW
ncbi:recombinase family protein [Magnetovibrio sp. PR-2]|uniref:recombinase family protein n=1 Tax=Magnetovibrio sp. PR-2 TaxID=3120356 RepID=UPI002FCE4809